MHCDYSLLMWTQPARVSNGHFHRIRAGELAKFPELGTAASAAAAANDAFAGAFAVQRDRLAQLN